MYLSLTPPLLVFVALVMCEVAFIDLVRLFLVLLYSALAYGLRILSSSSVLDTMRSTLGLGTVSNIQI
jgi:hypothetical protein